MPMQADQTQKSSGLPVAYWAGVYSISVSTLYLWGYWSVFSINILEHLSIADVVKAAAYPIISVFSFFALGVLLADVLQVDGVATSGGESLSKVGLFLKRHIKTFAITSFLFVVVFSIFGPIEKWLVLPIFIAAPLAHKLKSVIPRFYFIKSDSGQDTVRYLLVTLPFFAFGNGVVNASYIKSGKEYLYVASKIQQSDSKYSESPGYQLRYIGKADSRYFLYTPETESVLIVPDDKVLELKAFRKNAR